MSEMPHIMLDLKCGSYVWNCPLCYKTQKSRIPRTNFQSYICASCRGVVSDIKLSDSKKTESSDSKTTESSK